MPSLLGIKNLPVARLVERQLRNWEFARQQRDGGPAPRAGQVMDFLTISRSVGVPGDKIAAAIHKELDWPMFHRELLQAMAGDDKCRRRLYDAMDERDLGWLEEFVRAMSFSDNAKDDYFHRLTETVLSLARKGHAIFLGRAADLILPREMGLRVRITASRAYCIRQYAKAKGVSLKQARREVERVERERSVFIRRHFRVDAAEPTRHDLIINLEYITLNQAVDLILTLMRSKGIAR